MHSASPRSPSSAFSDDYKETNDLYSRYNGEQDEEEEEKETHLIGHTLDCLDTDQGDESLEEMYGNAAAMDTNGHYVLENNFSSMNSDDEIFEQVKNTLDEYKPRG
eukprot:360950_1